MLGNNLAYLRKRKKLSQEELAKIIGVAKPTLSSYEQNKRMPDMDIQGKIADYFGVSLDYLHDRIAKPNGATDEDVLDIEEAIRDNVSMLYGGIKLDEEDKQKLEQTLRLVFWDKIKEKKRKKE
jgi:transcriptional regulator with XRE-family HTH domain